MAYLGSPIPILASHDVRCPFCTLLRNVCMCQTNDFFNFDHMAISLLPSCSLICHPFLNFSFGMVIFSFFCFWSLILPYFSIFGPNIGCMQLEFWSYGELVPMLDYLDISLESPLRVYFEVDLIICCIGGIKQNRPYLFIPSPNFECFCIFGVLTSRAILLWHPLLHF